MIIPASNKVDFSGKACQKGGAGAIPVLRLLFDPFDIISNDMEAPDTYPPRGYWDRCQIVH